MLLKMTQLISEMRPHIIKCGFAEFKFEILMNMVKENTDEIYLKIDSLYENEYKAVKRIWTTTMMSPETWAMYEALGGMNGAREVKMLRSALHKFKLKLEEIVNAKVVHADKNAKNIQEDGVQSN